MFTSPVRPIKRLSSCLESSKRMSSIGQGTVLMSEAEESILPSSSFGSAIRVRFLSSKPRRSSQSVVRRHRVEPRHSMRDWSYPHPTFHQRYLDTCHHSFHSNLCFQIEYRRIVHPFRGHSTTVHNQSGHRSTPQR